MPGKTSDLLLAVECRKRDDMTLIIKQQQKKTITDYNGTLSNLYSYIDVLEISISTKHFLAYITMIIKTVCTHSIAKKKNNILRHKKILGI